MSFLNYVSLSDLKYINYCCDLERLLSQNGSHVFPITQLLYFMLEHVKYWCKQSK